jgi:replication-associated recombination protein RarA
VRKINILESTSKNGLLCEELVSALQKSIRRGLEEEAAAFAYELFLSGEEYEDLVWKRLMVISVEDIGIGEPLAAVVVNILNVMRKQYDYETDPDRPMFFTHAIVYLCRCQKDRSSALLKSITKRKFSAGEKVEIPDYALDMHTERGREMGRDMLHFLTEASMVIPQKGSEDRGYKERLIEMIKNNKNS